MLKDSSSLRFICLRPRRVRVNVLERVRAYVWSGRELNPSVVSLFWFSSLFLSSNSLTLMPIGVPAFARKSFPSTSFVSEVKLSRRFLALSWFALCSLCLYKTPLRGSRPGIGPGLGLPAFRHFATISRQEIVYIERASSIEVSTPKVLKFSAFLYGVR